MVADIAMFIGKVKDKKFTVFHSSLSVAIFQKIEKWIIFAELELVLILIISKRLRMEKII